MIGLDEIRCLNKDKISVIMRWVCVWVGGIYKYCMVNRGGLLIYNDKLNILLYWLKGIVIDVFDNRN